MVGRQMHEPNANTQPETCVRTSGEADPGSKSGAAGPDPISPGSSPAARLFPQPGGAGAAVEPVGDERAPERAAVEPTTVNVQQSGDSLAAVSAGRPHPTMLLAPFNLPNPSHSNDCKCACEDEDGAGGAGPDVGPSAPTEQDQTTEGEESKGAAGVAAPLLTALLADTAPRMSAMSAPGAGMLYNFWGSVSDAAGAAADQAKQAAKAGMSAAGDAAGSDARLVPSGLGMIFICLIFL
jgi:hypothetical protein